jgi:metallo-beta-lactamase family protein
LVENFYDRPAFGDKRTVYLKPEITLRVRMSCGSADWTARRSGKIAGTTERKNMHVTFYGAVREVTGSMHLLSTETDSILFDCGMFQGHREETDRKNRVLPFDPGIITNLILSHAHIDHSGRIPLLTRTNFTGRIVCTRATADACEYLLEDSAKIQESDAEYLNYKKLRNFLLQLETEKHSGKIVNDSLEDIKKRLKKERHELNVETINALISRYHLESVKPLYSVQDARAALSFFDGYPYNHPVTVGNNLTCTFYDAGHILGSAISIVQKQENGRSCTVGFSGDIGRFGKPIVKNPAIDFAENHRHIDLMIMESTYGDRLHEPVADLKTRLAEVLNKTHERGGSIIVPAFAYGRTQELLYYIHQIYDERLAPRFPVFVDSPLATKITRVFAEHPEVYDRDAHKDFLEKGINPFRFDQVHFVSSVEESMALNRETTPHIVISASGMCEAGRILHHLRYKIHNEKNTILLVGYMARNTLGRRILESGRNYEAQGRKGDPPLLRFLGKEYPLKAHVVLLEGFSAHGDQGELMRFLKGSNLEIGKIAVVHGEEDQCLAFTKHLRENGFHAVAPRPGETLQVR